MPLICEIRYLKSKLNLNLHCSVRVGLSVDSNDDAGGQAAAAGTLRDITQRFIFIHCFLIHSEKLPSCSLPSLEQALSIFLLIFLFSSQSIFNRLKLVYCAANILAGQQGTLLRKTLILLQFLHMNSEIWARLRSIWWRMTRPSTSSWRLKLRGMATIMRGRSTSAISRLLDSSKYFKIHNLK